MITLSAHDVDRIFSMACLFAQTKGQSLEYSLEHEIATYRELKAKLEAGHKISTGGVFSDEGFKVTLLTDGSMTVEDVPETWHATAQDFVP